jgi:toxin ParE1/3/4
VKIRYSPEAVADLENIEEYHSDKAGTDTATSLVKRIRDTLEKVIRRNPRAGRARPDLGEGVRTFPVLPYVVFYQIENGRMYIIRILHGRRDIRPPLASLLIAG